MACLEAKALAEFDHIALPLESEHNHTESHGDLQFGILLLEICNEIRVSGIEFGCELFQEGSFLCASSI